jgi:AhpD family alkylhydroperoxidase
MTFDNRTTELIAIGASVAANCPSCVEYHLAGAAEYGIEQNELVQAVEIGRMVRKGAAGNVDRVVDRLLRKDASATNAATGDRAPAGETACCSSAFKRAAAGEPGGASTSFATRCAPFTSMAAGWSGEFPFRGD